MCSKHILMLTAYLGLKWKWTIIICAVVRAVVVKTVDSCCSKAKATIRIPLDIDSLACSDKGSKHLDVLLRCVLLFTDPCGMNVGFELTRERFALRYAHLFTLVVSRFLSLPSLA